MFLDFRYWSDPKQWRKRLMFRDLVPKEENPGHIHTPGRQPGAKGGLDQGPGANPVGAGSAQPRCRKRVDISFVLFCGRVNRDSVLCHVQVCPSVTLPSTDMAFCFQRSACKSECSWESATSRSWTSSPVRQRSATEPSTVF